MIEATSMAVSYDEDEDRLLIICTNETERCSLWLTRRMTGRLLRTFVDLIERVNPVLGKVPAGMRTEMIAFEHLSAINQPQRAAPPGATVRDESAVALVTTVNVTATPDAFRLIFHSPQGPVASFTGLRTNFHKTLSLLNQCATAADWNVGEATEWLEPSDPAHVKGRLVS